MNPRRSLSGTMSPSLPPPRWGRAGVGVGVLSVTVSVLRKTSPHPNPSPSRGGAAKQRSMPATPAWPPKSLPRLFLRQPLGEGSAVELDAKQANYLGNVMRLGIGAELLVFDGNSGEWLARVAAA